MPGINIAEYLHGRCHIFALALHTALGYPMEFLWDLAATDDETWEDREALVHAFCKRPDGAMVHVTGTFTQAELEEDFAQFGVQEPDLRRESADDVQRQIAEGLLEAPRVGEVEQLVSYINEIKERYTGMPSKRASRRKPKLLTKNAYNMGDQTGEVIDSNPNGPLNVEDTSTPLTQHKTPINMGNSLSDTEAKIEFPGLGEHMQRFPSRGKI